MDDLFITFASSIVIFVSRKDMDEHPYESKQLPNMTVKITRS